MTTKMLAPGQLVGVNVSVPTSTNVYLSDSNGLVAANSIDVIALAAAGFTVVPQRPVVVLPSSGYIVPGAVNVIPSTAASSVSYTYLMAAPATGNLGLHTTILQQVASTAVSTVTSSGANFGSSMTVLTFSSIGCVDLESIGSTQFAVTGQRPVTSSAGAAIVYQPQSS